jgi:tetratricopeptide (TPR) repeat protein
MKYLKVALNEASNAKEVLYELNVLINLALVEECNKLYEDALTHMERALLLDPSNPKIEEKIASLQESIANKTPEPSHITEEAPRIPTPEPEPVIEEVKTEEDYDDMGPKFVKSMECQ